MNVDDVWLSSHRGPISLDGMGPFSCPGNTKGARRRLVDAVPCGKEIGAGEGIRTLDPNLGKVVLYP